MVVNLVGSPGHVGASSEVTAALSIVDGSMVARPSAWHRSPTKETTAPAHPSHISAPPSTIPSATASQPHWILSPQSRARRVWDAETGGTLLVIDVGSEVYALAFFVERRFWT